MSEDRSGKPITLLDVKQAMRDHRFRSSLPPEMKEDLQKYLQNPGCACNMPIYRNVLKTCQLQLQQYFPGRDVSDPDAELTTSNNFTVIDCHVKDLESRLNKLVPSHYKQIAVSRYEDKVVVIINEIMV